MAGDNTIGITPNPSTTPTTDTDVGVDRGAESAKDESAKRIKAMADSTDVQEVAVGLTDISQLTPEQLVQFAKQEKARLDKTYPDFPQLEENLKEIPPSELEGYAEQLKTIQNMYALLTQLIAMGAAAPPEHIAQTVQSAEAPAAKGDGDVGKTKDTDGPDEKPGDTPDALGSTSAERAKARELLRKQQSQGDGGGTGAGTGGGPGGAAGAAGAQGNRWLAGTSYVAMLVAIQNMARSLSSQTAVEAAAGRQMRTLEVDNVQAQKETILHEAQIKKDMLTKQMITKAVAAGLSVGAHIGGSLYYGKSEDAGAKIQALTTTANATITSLSDAVQKGFEMQATIPLAEQEAAKVIQRDQYEAYKQQQQNASKYATDAHDLVTRAFDAVMQMMSEMRRHMTANRS